MIIINSNAKGGRKEEMLVVFILNLLCHVNYNLQLINVASILIDISV